MNSICFEKPADRWEEALPIGNGRLGAMIFGGQEKEVIQLNQDSIWYGSSINRINPEAKGHLNEIRGLILEGKIPEAEKLMTYTLSGIPQSQRPYQTLGNIELTYYNQGGYLSDYGRMLDLENGKVTESYQLQSDNKSFHICKEYLASYPHGILSFHLKADEGTISFDAILRRNRFYDHAGKLDNRTIFMDGSLGEKGISFFTALRADVTDGSVKTLGEHLLVRDATEVTLYLSCETSFYAEDYKTFAVKKLNYASHDGFTCIRQKHQKDYQRLYHQVSLHLDGEENSFAETYFQFGRYLLISCSRPGSLPANLQGIWNDSYVPAWDSKFTININTEMNYWPAEICGLSECHLPLFDHLLRMWDNGKMVAKEMYHCRGFAAHHNTDIWGDCAPQDLYVPATYWVMGGAWLATHIWTHYTYSGDIDFLKKMYPFLKDTVLFFHDFLIEDHGDMVTCPSVSPENTYILPDGTKGRVCAGSSIDTQILKDLLNDYLKASNVFNIEDDDTKRTREILNLLPPTKIGKHGQIMEWREDYDEAEPGHRHISQLYALHPSHQITPDKTPELSIAAEKTLERRLHYGGGHTGWSCAWIVNFYARLGNGKKALENLEKLWRQSTFPNLMDSHPRGEGAVFQIDGNLGATAAIAEMLMQADEDRIVLFPALPKKWKSGSVSGLRAPGGIQISLAWSDGKLIHGTLISSQTQEINLVYGKIKRSISVTAGRQMDLDKLLIPSL
ncbi:glycoside hydrolase family 95 protein [Blautia liquoris]|uniref:Glycoside hydrolase family 95 protein n=1 Tax=Blautia liquoris TaxID=2779518 RepID=A0A7M2RGH9_9FIRM|nr:glycoside hydrolase family 95 protein [Blautia liquoris]QOV19435.1 glycoside hydrolase family 95 protein [Blautia liquoris]